MKKITILILIYSSVYTRLYSQVTQDWVAKYYGGQNSRASSCVVDNNGDVYVTGSTTNIITVKYNSAGVQQWVSTYIGPQNNDYSKDIKIDNLGNVYVAGSGVFNAGGIYGAILIKYNSSGTQQWVFKDTSSSNYIFGTAIVIDDSNNIYLGESYGIFISGSGSLNKLNSSGNLLWHSDNGRVKSLIIDRSHNIIASGTVNFNYFTTKYNSAGSQLWSVAVPGPGAGNDATPGITTDNGNNVYLCGPRWINDTAYSVIVKYYSSGVQQWISYFNNSTAYDIAVDSSNNIYISGYFSYWLISNGSFFLRKCNNSGTQQWIDTIGYYSNSNYISPQLVTDIIGNSYVTVASAIAPSFQTDIVTMRYNSSGSEQWQISYNGSADSNDYPVKLFIDSQNNVYVSGTSIELGTGYNFVTIKYSQPIGIKPISSQVPDEYRLYQNFPNPFNPATKIKFDVPKTPLPPFRKGGSVTLKVYDLIGREVATLVNEKLQPGTYEVEWDPEKSGQVQVSSGVYFYKLTTSNFTDTKKMVLIK